MTLGWFDGGDGDADLWRSEQRKHDYVYISAGWNEMEKRVPLMDGVLCVPPTLAILFSGGYLRFQGIHPHPDKVSISSPTHFTAAMVITPLLYAGCHSRYRTNEKSATLDAGPDNLLGLPESYTKFVGYSFDDSLRGNKILFQDLNSTSPFVGYPASSAKSEEASVFFFFSRCNHLGNGKEDTKEQLLD